MDSRTNYQVTYLTDEFVLRVPLTTIRVVYPRTQPYFALSSASSAGIPLRDLMELSSHSDLGTLQRYLQVSEEAKKKAAMTFA